MHTQNCNTQVEKKCFHDKTNWWFEGGKVEWWNLLSLERLFNAQTTKCFTCIRTQNESYLRAKQNGQNGIYFCCILYPQIIDIFSIFHNFLFTSVHLHWIFSVQAIRFEIQILFFSSSIEFYHFLDTVRNVFHILLFSRSMIGFER